VSKFAIYELPLNERIRTFLRLEFLFEQALYSLRGYTVWDSRFTITSILEISNILARLDLRTELFKELERQKKAIQALSSIPGVDLQILQQTLANLNEKTQLLLTGTPNADPLKGNELLKIIRQRESIPGGTCDFDVPVYHHWLTRPPEERIKSLEMWLNHFDIYRATLLVLLKNLRESAALVPVTAKEGFYQQALDSNSPAQLIRVFLEPGSYYYAELSGGKHRFSVRFMTTENYERPLPFSENISFQLACCVL